MSYKKYNEINDQPLVDCAGFGRSSAALAPGETVAAATGPSQTTNQTSFFPSPGGTHVLSANASSHLGAGFAEGKEIMLTEQGNSLSINNVQVISREIGRSHIGQLVDNLPDMSCDAGQRIDELSSDLSAYQAELLAQDMSRHE